MEESAARVTVELIGVAGAGKSSIASALVALDGRIRARPRVDNGTYVATVPTLLPTFLSLHWPPRRVLTKEMKRILRVHALHRMVRTASGPGLILFDEGPLYMLARLLVFGGAAVQTRAFAHWWHGAIALWARSLSAIVWVDASDDVLAARLNTRPQSHRLRGASDSVIRAFLASYRDAYRRVLADLAAAGGPAPWMVKTDDTSVHATAHAILARIRTLSPPALPVVEIA
jgi:shikimate kinase